MLFRSERDTFFTTFIIVILIVLGLVCFLPIILDPDAWTPGLAIFWVGTFALCEGLIIWSFFGIKYVFKEDYLYVQGGLFRSRIPYEEITKIEKTESVFIGYRILSAKKGIELFYKKSMWGSVKISPLKRAEFLDELQKRCPDISVKL